MKQHIERMHLKHYRAGARQVRVHWNRLTGSIPVQLGDLSRAVGSWAAGASLPFRINVRSSGRHKCHFVSPNPPNEWGEEAI